MASALTNPYPALTATAALWEVAAPGVAAVAYDASGKYLYAAFPAENRVARWSTDGAELMAAWAPWPGVSTVRCGGGLLAAAGAAGIAAFDLKTGGQLPLAPWAAGAVAALAVDATGQIFAAEPAADRVWAGGAGGWRVVVDGPAFPRPTGLLAVANLLFVATAGTADAPGRVAAVNLKTGAVQPVTPKPAGALYGLDRDDKCYYITLDTATWSVLRVSPVGEVSVLLPHAVGCGPPAVLPDRRVLVLPRPDRVAAYSLDTLRK